MISESNYLLMILTVNSDYPSMIIECTKIPATLC